MKQFSIKQREFLPYELKTTKLLSEKQKIANYEDADYCFITSKKTIALLLMELRPLFERGGVYYKIYNKIDAEEDFLRSPKDVKKQILVIFFDDSVIDTMAERMKIKCKLAEFDVELPFLSYAVEMYEPFNSR